MRRGNSMLALVALVVAVVAVPLVAQADDPSGDCPNARWALTALGAVDSSVTDKAASRDSNGNGDGFVCQKQNKHAKFQVTDNSKPSVPETSVPSSEGFACPSGTWELTALDAVDSSVTDKAASRDSNGNGDGFVCQKQNRHAKFQVKDNNNPGVADPAGTEPQPDV